MFRPRSVRGVLAVVAAVMVLRTVDANALALSRGPLLQNPDGLSTTVTVLWWTDTAGNSTVDYGTTAALGQSVTVGQAASCSIGAAGTCHTVQLTGLTPGTQYYYRLVTNGVVVLPMTYFRTFKAATDTSELFFDVIGDWGQGTAGQLNLSNLMYNADPPTIISVGDNVYTNGTQSDWDNNGFTNDSSGKRGYKSLLQRALWFPVLGNHDLNSVGNTNWQNSVEILMHDLPRNAPAGQEERYFSFENGDALFIALDANPPALGSQQATWLANTLAASTRKWKFAFLHQASHSCANGIASFGSNATVRATFGHIFEQYGVDIVFEGHDHIYERSIAVDEYVVGGASGSDGLTTRYVMTGGGGASLDSRANADGGGAYRQPLFGSKSYCPWLASGCPGGPSSGANGPYCSFARFSYVEVKIQNNETLTMKGIDENNVVMDTLTITKSTGTCGNALVEAGEDCDGGACCTVACAFAAGGSQCRAANGACDVAESCTGTSSSCPADGFLTAGTACRAVANLCDVAESCTGASPACPADGVATAGTPCRTAAGVCDLAETCNGSSITCPADAKSTAGCRAAGGVCDLAETCNGVANDCPADVRVAAGTVCRGSAGACDVGETCDGSAVDCPVDGFVSGGTECRAAAGSCDVAENCSGSSAGCPADGFASAGTNCRVAAGACDVAEVCTGSSGACPGDILVSAGTVCRAAAGVCDLVEQCTGSGAACPSDQKSTGVCRAAAGACDTAEACDGTNDGCPADVLANAGTVCRAAAGACDVAETCTGSAAGCPTDGFMSAGTGCRAAVGVCDVAETCSGTVGACPADGFVVAGTSCRAAAGACDLPETCTGSTGTCPADAFASGATVCRAAAGACDLTESCSGSGAACPTDQKSTAVCRAAAGACDQPESCDGTLDTCPADVLTAAGTICRAAVGTCDAQEICDGTTAVCPADILSSAGTVCRASAGDCDLQEACSGSSGACPADAKSTAQCRPSTGICDPAETCNGVTNACPANLFSPTTTVCRAAFAACDVPENCTGSSGPCPTDVVSPSTTVCRAAAGACDLAETCTGTLPTCPADAKSTAVCRAAAGVCDLAESCDGSNPACPSDAFASSATVCRAAADLCDQAELCGGTSAACPGNGVAAVGVVCRAAASACDAAETCDGVSMSCPADTGQPDGDGDGICDGQDRCPSTPDPLQADADADGRGDLCDPCTNPSQTAVVGVKVLFKKLGPPPGDEKFKFTGTVTVPVVPTIDPPSNGVRILVADALGGTPLDAIIPGGAYSSANRVGWSANGAGTSWRYKNAGSPMPLIGGITKVKISANPSSPGTLKFSVGGANGTYPVGLTSIPLVATFIVDPPVATTGQCGEADFTGPAPICSLNSAGSTLKCR